MAKAPAGWLQQADYDMDTAEAMFASGRYFYAVFMCHQSIEKALKGIYHLKLSRIPPRTHNLVYFLKHIGVKPPEGLGKFIVQLNEASVATRYPEDLAELTANYTKPIVRDILSKG